MNKSLLYLVLVGLSAYIAFWYLSSVGSNEQEVSSLSLRSAHLTGSIDDYFVNNVFLHKTTIEVLNGMTIEQKAGQVLMPAWEKGTSIDQFIAQANKYHVGGMMVLRKDTTVGEVKTIKAALSLPVGFMEIEPLMSIDAEPSLLKYRLPSIGYKTNTDQLDSEEKSYGAGVEIGEIISKYGYNYNFAPVYDTGVNKSIIGDRAFGVEESDIVSRAGSFAEGLSITGIIATAKHFPGHGSVVGDTHKTLQTVPSDLPELGAFRKAIEEETLSIMVGHLAVSGGEYDTQGKPATISKNIVDGLLREELGYEGLIITDAMVMGALDGFANPDITAIESGVDIILMPRDLSGTHKSLVERMTTDQDFEREINEKVYRIIRMKLASMWSEA